MTWGICCLLMCDSNRLNHTGLAAVAHRAAGYRGTTRQDRNGDLLITKYGPCLQTLHWFYTEVPVVNNLGKLLSLSR